MVATADDQSCNPVSLGGRVPVSTSFIHNCDTDVGSTSQLLRKPVKLELFSRVSADSNPIVVDDKKIRFRGFKELHPLFCCSMEDLRGSLSEEIGEDGGGPDAFEDGKRSDDQNSRIRSLAHEEVGSPQSCERLSDTHIAEHKASGIEDEEIGRNSLTFVGRDSGGAGPVIVFLRDHGRYRILHPPQRLAVSQGRRNRNMRTVNLSCLGQALQ